MRSFILPITLFCDLRLGRLLPLDSCPINDSDDDDVFNRSFWDGRRGSEFDWSSWFFVVLFSDWDDVVAVSLRI